MKKASLLSLMIVLTVAIVAVFAGCTDKTETQTGREQKTYIYESVEFEIPASSEQSLNDRFGSVESYKESVRDTYASMGIILFDDDKLILYGLGDSPLYSEMSYRLNATELEMDVETSAGTTQTVTAYCDETVMKLPLGEEYGCKYTVICRYSKESSVSVEDKACYFDSIIVVLPADSDEESLISEQFGSIEQMERQYEEFYMEEMGDSAAFSFSDGKIECSVPEWSSFDKESYVKLGSEIVIMDDFVLGVVNGDEFEMSLPVYGFNDVTLKVIFKIK